MKVEKLILGDLDTNCYIISENSKCLIIDPASDTNLIKDKCKNFDVEGILVTHHHFDHVGALNELENFYNIKHNTHNNSFNYEIISTPGHTDDSITFYFRDNKIMFTGDFIFYHTCGRCDFYNSSINDMKNSLENIKKYDDDIVVYPGHGDSSILGDEKKFFKLYF